MFRITLSDLKINFGGQNFHDFPGKLTYRTTYPPNFKMMLFELLFLAQDNSLALASGEMSSIEIHFYSLGVLQDFRTHQWKLDLRNHGTNDSS